MITRNFPVPGRDSVVPARHFYLENGWTFVDGMPTRITREVQGATKVRVPGVDKPLVAARKSRLQKFFFENLSSAISIQLFPLLRRLRKGKAGTHRRLLEIASEHPFLREPLKKLLRLTSPDVVYEKVTSVSKAPRIDTYDLTVKGTPHFLANGFVVHNCKHLYALYYKKLAGKVPGL